MALGTLLIFSSMEGSSLVSSAVPRSLSNKASGCAFPDQLESDRQKEGKKKCTHAWGVVGKCLHD
jgi:hypothetical protein